MLWSISRLDTLKRVRNCIVKQRRETHHESLPAQLEPPSGVLLEPTWAMASVQR